MAFKLYQVNRISFDIDLLANQLAPVKKDITLNSSIGFYTNYGNSDMYIKTQYLLAPCVVLNKLTPDTLLILQNKADTVKQFNNYRTISQNQNGTVSIITKVK
jgi:hypothetical protein